MYILECADGTYYTGSTRNLERRIEEHHTGSYPDGYTAVGDRCVSCTSKGTTVSTTPGRASGRSTGGVARRSAR
ncbi:MAG: GIY-YIG nuclease family protein [Pseudolysinimonas sp.]